MKAKHQTYFTVITPTVVCNTELINADQPTFKPCYLNVYVIV